MNEIKQLLADEIKKHLFPGCSLGLVSDNDVSFFSIGQQTYDSESPLINERTVYDVASITKSIPTACLVLQLVEVGDIKLDDSLDQYLTETRSLPLGTITIRQLLSFKPQFPFTLSLLKDKTASEILSIIVKSNWSMPVVTDYPISNATAILLTMVLQRVTGQSIDRLAENKIFLPLGMDQTTFHPENFLLTRIAPTEIQEWRGGLIHGKVHDESAWKIRELFISGSAGLFSCTQDLTKFVKSQLSEVDVPNLGWEFNRSWMGRKVSNLAFGKTGFTGCFILIDPIQSKGIVFLSNCVYPKRPDDREQFNNFRIQLNELVF